MSHMVDDIDEMNRKMLEHQERYGSYLRLIAKNEPDVVITNEREIGKMQNSTAATVSKLNGDIAQLESKLADLQSN
jgi:hypothetical protein